jgi:hypothetical protein
MFCFVQKEEGLPPKETKPNNKSQQEDQHKTVQDNPSLDQREPVGKYHHKTPDERKSTNLRKISEPNQPAEIRQFFKELRPPDIGIPGPVKSSMEAGHSSVEATITTTSVEVDPHHSSRIGPAKSDSGLVKAALYKRKPGTSDNSSAHSQSTEVQPSLPFHSSGIRQC